MKGIICAGRLTTCILLAGLLAGCAFGTREATLVYPPSPEGEAKVAVAKAVSPVARETKIHLRQFADERSDKKVVGTVRNAYGMRTADVVSKNSVTAWITEAIALELKNRGFTVVQGEAKSPPEVGSIVMGGDILNVFCDMYLSYTGQVSLVVKVTDSSGEVFSRHYAGEGSAGIAFAATSESFAASLSQALAAALEKMMADIDAKFPPAGK
ncbi:MAG: hypothetical protein J0M13_10390 [Candidatus Accumulibacter sp.]|nr:hypothetical protein [Candidatus Accumulibacter necessarius]